MVVIPVEYFYVGEKPPPTNCRYVDAVGDLITDISGATLTAKTSIDDGANVDVSCTNADDGTFTIDWPDGASPSVFTASGSMRIKIHVSHGDLDYYLKPELVVKIRDI